MTLPVADCQALVPSSRSMPKMLSPSLRSSVNPRTIDRDLLMPLTRFVALLPGAKPRVFKGAIETDSFNPISADPNALTFEYQGIVVTFEQYEEFLVLNDNDTPCLTPAGAAWVLELYAKGLIPMRRKSAGTPPDEAIAYSRSHDDLVRQTEQRRAQARAAAEAYAAKLANPGAIPESEFTYSLLNDLSFRVRREGGPCEFDAGGLRITKHVATLRSNSGNTEDSSVSFQWRSNGELHTISKESRFAGNRRNDAERNWGLPPSGY